ncbi:MAG: hypothetical protein JWM00_665 [Candidatus Saccharibacteria bacterium]|nr:hypothetical protein [Candidatus Saccharibacteria bacterium]
MNKDVIYIDVDDDITAVIGKLKDSKEKVVALVPPKRVGMLQSAVNLRLLDRAAHNANKHLVLITNNPALIALAAAAKLPVAKNLQSKPELPEIAALDIDDGDDVIDGADLPIGDHAGTAMLADDDTATDKAAASLMTGAKAAPPTDGTPPRPPKAKNGSRVPNFDSFRKKLFIGIGAGILLIGFLIWAIFFAAHATVVITARTATENVSKTVTLNQTGPTSFSGGVIKSIRQEQKKSQSVDFDATGQKDVGSKATGTVRFSTDSISKLGTVIPAGTQLTSSSGLVYITNQSVTMNTNNYTGANSPVTAAENGTQYNAATGNVSGAPSGISASFVGATSGGVSKMVVVVTAADVQKAAEQLATQEDPAVKAQLKAAFGKDVRVIDTSYAAQKGDPASVPAVGQEATKAKLTTEIIYSMVGVAESELSTYLDAAVKEEIADQPNQRVYDNGLKAASFTDFVTDATGSKARLVANGKVGPQINDDDIKAKVKGKQYGDIQADIGAIQGVDDVDTKFWPFWVRSVPNDTKRITIEFKLNEQK